MSYDLQVATDASFSDLEVDAEGLEAPSYAGGLARFEETYHWRVRAVGPGGESGWSTEKSFETEAPRRLYYLKDHLGSVRAVVDPDAAAGDKVKEVRDYYPFGLRMPGRSTAEGTEAKEDFTGHERDAATGLHYAGARYYLSAYGRWNAVDPLADDFPAYSSYNYALNNPLSLVDPTGMAACDIVLCGQNGSSITIETDAIDVEVDVSSLPGTDFGGNHTLEGQDVVQAGLDLAGIVDPTGFADGANASMYLSDGDWLNAGISAAGLIPYAGDLIKAGRVGKQLGTITSALSSSKGLLTAGSHVPNAGGKIVSFVSQQDEIYYRVFSGQNNVGSFLTKTRPKSAAFAKEGLALPPSNGADFIQQVRVPAGTTLQRSRALPAFGRRGGLEQFELLNYIPTSSFGPGVPLK